MRPGTKKLVVKDYVLSTTKKIISPEQLHAPIEEGLIFVSSADSRVEYAIMDSMITSICKSGKKVIRISLRNDFLGSANHYSQWIETVEFPGFKDAGSHYSVAESYSTVEEPDYDDSPIFDTFCEFIEEIEEREFDVVVINDIADKDEMAAAAILGSRGYLVLASGERFFTVIHDAVAFLEDKLKDNLLLEQFWEGYEGSGFLGEPVENYLLKRSVFSDAHIDRETYLPIYIPGQGFKTPTKQPEQLVNTVSIDIQNWE